MAVATIKRGRRTAVAQVIQCIEVGRRQVFDVDVIAQARAVGSRVVGTEDRHLVALAGCRFAGNLDEQGGLGCRLSDRTARLAAGDVEVAQGDVAGSARKGEVFQHPLGHEFGRAVRIDRLRWRILRRLAAVRHAVDRSRR